MATDQIELSWPLVLELQLSLRLAKWLRDQMIQAAGYVRPGYMRFYSTVIIKLGDGALKA